jgi:disulfide bond formation protein DsbB
MHGEATANTFFTVLTLAANLAVVALGVLAVAAAISPGARRRARRLVVLVSPQARPLALLVATVATAGSLYYSEVVGFAPCELCWFQRVCMYPLVAILAVGVARRDPTARWYAAPFVLVGVPLGLYHWLVERVPSIAASASCSATVPCAVPYFEQLGYVTLAFMAMSAFLLIGGLLLVEGVGARVPAAAVTP